jgi:streptomycin 6-kinase
MPDRNSFNLPQKFVQTITSMFGDAGEKWLAQLPVLINEIAAEWRIEVAGHFANLSYHYVAPCLRPDGSDAVLKIGFPGEVLEFRNEVNTLRLYGGEGAVALFDHDDKRSTMLLEKISPGESLGNLCLENDEEAVKIAAGILKKIVRPVQADADFHLLENWMGGFRRVGKTEFPQEVLAKARAYYRELSGGNRKFLLHGDFHHENILSAGREPYLVIDPKGLIGEVGYDIGVFLNNHRNWLDGMDDIEAKLGSAIEHFAEGFGLTQKEIRKWAYVQMVLSAFWTFEENDERWQGELHKAEIWQV